NAKACTQRTPRKDRGQRKNTRPTQRPRSPPKQIGGGRGRERVRESGKPRREPGTPPGRAGKPRRGARVAGRGTGIYFSSAPSAVAPTSVAGTSAPSASASSSGSPSSSATTTLKTS